MSWVLVLVCGALAVAVGVLALRVRSLEQRVARLAAAPASSDPNSRFSTVDNLPFGSLDAPPAADGFVITHLGAEARTEPGGEAPTPAPEVVATVPGPVFADMVVKEGVVQAASLVQGLRRALSPETRNRIRFHMRQEVKRSRKQRRTELREVRREWAARQRAAAAGEPPAEGSAA